MIKLAALWKKESKEGRTYYQGQLGEARLLLFINADKKSEKAPDLNLFIVAQKKSKTKNLNENDDIPF